MTDRKGVIGLREGGRRLWKSLSKGLDESGLALLEEACRAKDRCDRLAELVDGEGREWVRFLERDDGSVTVVVDKALDEARQYSLAFKALMTEFRQFQKRAGKPAEGVPDGVADLAARIAARRASS